MKNFLIVTLLISQDIWFVDICNNKGKDEKKRGFVWYTSITLKTYKKNCLVYCPDVKIFKNEVAEAKHCLA